MTMPIGRRAFLISAAMSTGAGLGGCWLATLRPDEALTGVAREIASAPGLLDLGTEQLFRQPEEATVDALVAALLDGLPPGQVPAALEEQIGADFDAERVSDMGGWLLARTELRLCALAALLAGDDPMTPSGLFSLVASSAPPHRWTTPVLRLSIDAAVGRITIPLRNPAPFERRVDVSLHGRPADQLLLPPVSPWNQVSYSLGVSAGRARALDFTVSPPWQPPDDYRTIGLALGALIAR